MSAQVSQNNRQENYHKKHSLGSWNMTNMFYKIIQDFISIGSLTGLFLNSHSDDSLAKWDMIFANAKLLTKQIGYNTY